MGEEDRRDSWFSGPRDNYDVNTRIMLTAILSLSFVVILVGILHIYARCVLRRHERRQATLRRLGLLRISTTVHAPEPPKTGLHPSVIASLPISKYIGNSNSVECSVCLSGLEDGEMVRTLPNCRHTFHVDCIDKWFATNSTCPVCRTEAQPRLVAEPREGVAAAATDPSAPPLEGTSDGPKTGGSSSSSRLSSFRRILSRERSSRRIHVQSCGHEDGLSLDLERQ